MDEPTLFDLAPAPAPDKPSYGQQLTQRRRAMLAAGVHPVTRQPLLDRDRGLTCRDCAHLFAHGRASTYWKCELNASRGPVTDIRVSWPACSQFTPAEQGDTR